MIPARHPSATRTLAAPGNWKEQENGRCSSLPILDHERDGLRWMESLWEPLPEELEALKKGGKVILNIQGVGHPVVSLGVSVPEEEEAPSLAT